MSISESDTGTETESDSINKQLCYECQSENLIIETGNGTIVCTDCGVVNKEILDKSPEWNNLNDSKNDLSRYGCPTNYLLPQSSLGTKVSYGYYSKISIMERWQQMPYTERSLNEVLQYM